MAAKKGNWFYLVGGETLGAVTNQAEVSTGALPLRHGVNFELELKADRMLADARKGMTKHSEIKEQGYFSAIQAYRRRMKEICVGLAPDSSIISGVPGRVYVPDPDSGPRDLSDEYDYDPDSIETYEIRDVEPEEAVMTITYSAPAARISQPKMTVAPTIETPMVALVEQRLRGKRAFLARMGTQAPLAPVVTAMVEQKLRGRRAFLARMGK